MRFVMMIFSIVVIIWLRVSGYGLKFIGYRLYFWGVIGGRYMLRTGRYRRELSALRWTNVLHRALVLSFLSPIFTPIFTPNLSPN